MDELISRKKNRIKNMTCPFCNQDVVFVGVHDDEGNYKGRIGCAYESDPWSGLCYGLHHDGWGECILCTDGPNMPLGGILFDEADEAEAALKSYAVTQTGEEVRNEEADLCG